MQMSILEQNWLIGSPSLLKDILLIIIITQLTPDQVVKGAANTSISNIIIV